MQFIQIYILSANHLKPFLESEKASLRRTFRSSSSSPLKLFDIFFSAYNTF